MLKVKSKIFKRKSGRNKGAWVLRLEYPDETGKTRYAERHTESKGAASDLKLRLVDEIKKSHGHIQTGEKMTFGNLADYCEKHFYKPAEYAEGRKIAGIRSLSGVQSAVSVLRLYFGARPIKTIYKASLRDYKAHRLACVSEKTGRKISIATANRELAILRRMLKVALSEGWILRDPFFGADVINAADENKRERIINREEEARLIAACEIKKEVIETKRAGKPFKMEVETKRGHLKSLIVLALDTGMRRGELFKLRWQDVNFENGTITVCATHTKTQKERLVPLTVRAERELMILRETAGDKERIFPFVDVKRAFKAVKDDAGLSDLRFHDLRHTAITRMVKGGISASEAGKIAGHTQPITTYRYVNTDLESIKTAASVLDEYARPLPEVETINQNENELIKSL